MNSSHNNGKSDEHLNDGLFKLGQAYGQLEQDEPPALLDQAILNSAHRAVEKTPRWMKFTWLHGLTTAAVFVLAFSLILNQQESVPRLESGMEIRESVRQQNEQAVVEKSSAVKTNSHKETSPESVTRQDRHRGTSAISASKAEATKGQARSQERQYQLQGAVQDDVAAMAEPVDQDMNRKRVMREEVSLDEADFMAIAPEPEDLIQKPSHPAVAAPLKKPGESESPEMKLSGTEAELKLLQIIEQKKSGDPGWRKALESFMESYPDYPVPDELKLP